MTSPSTFNATRLTAIQAALVGDCFPDLPPTDPLVQTTHQIFDGIYGLVRDLFFRRGPARDLFVEDPQKAFLRMAPLDISSLGPGLLHNQRLDDCSIVRTHEENVSLDSHDSSLGCELFISRRMTETETTPTLIFGVEISWGNRFKTGDHKYEQNYVLRVTRHFFQEQVSGPFQEYVELQLTHNTTDFYSKEFVESENKEQATATFSFRRPSIEDLKLTWEDLEISTASSDDTFDGYPFSEEVTNRAGNNTIEDLPVAWEGSLRSLEVVCEVLWPHIHMALGAQEMILPSSGETRTPYEILSSLISRWTALSEFEKAQILKRSGRPKEPPTPDQIGEAEQFRNALARIVNQPVEETLKEVDGAADILRFYYGEEVVRRAEEGFRPAPPARPPTAGGPKKPALRIVRSEPLPAPDKPPKKT